MKGVVLNLLEEAVRDTYGEDTWDELLADAQLDGAYSALATYPDDHVYALVEAASRKLGAPSHDIVRWFGRQAGHRFARRYPEFYANHRDTRAFLLTVNDIVHPHVRLTIPDADVPWFAFSNEPGGGLRMEYHSRRPMCALAEGLIEGSADHYGEQATIHQTTCKHRGDPHCTIVVGFGSGAR